MAKQLDLILFGDVPVKGTYWMVGVVELRPYHETGYVELWAYRNEQARRSLVDPVIVPPRRVNITRDNYVRYFSPEALSAEGSNVVKAAYRMCAEQPEPHGLKRLLEGAEDI